MATAKQVFDAMPHVTEVWITANGDHHLHSHNGGEKFTRGVAVIEEEPDEVVAPIDETKETPEPDEVVAPKSDTKSAKK